MHTSPRCTLRNIALRCKNKSFCCFYCLIFWVASERAFFVVSETVLLEPLFS